MSRAAPNEIAAAPAAQPDVTLDRVRAEARGCQRCPLWQIGTQTVFGDGPTTARLMFVGEAPGYNEDQQGRPFVGAAGALFDEALAAAGIARAEVYVTNTVKHRPFEPGGRHGRNRPPKQSEINACRVWLDQELAIVRPTILCCLGAVAAKSIFGRDFKLTQSRGQWLESPVARHALATLHPSVILIRPDPASRDEARRAFFADLALVGERYRAL
jgi:uracil-DNA glycosylase family protein